MSTNINTESSIVPGKLPSGFCPASEQARLEAYARALSVSPAAGRPGQRGEPGPPGQDGASGIPVITWGEDVQLFSLGDITMAWLIPSGVAWQDVRYFPIQLGKAPINSIEYDSIAGAMNITLTQAVAFTDGIAVVDPPLPSGSPTVPGMLFTWPIYTYPTPP